MSIHTTIKLPGSGRRIGIAEYGDPGGAPIFLFHGLPGSRLQFPQDDNLIAGLGARVLALDRPGIGNSDPAPRRTMLDWADDVACVADALEIENFSLLGLSGGGPYACVCAARLGGRVRGLMLVSALGPVDPPGALRRMALLPRLYLRVARHAPWMLTLPSYIFLKAHSYPRMVRMARPLAGISRHDRKALKGAGDEHIREEPAARINLQELYGRDFAEAVKQGIAGTMLDAQLLARPWGVDLGEIKCPVSLWYGTSDALTPPEMELALAAELPNCNVKAIDGEGHYLIFMYLREILGEIVGKN